MVTKRTMLLSKEVYLNILVVGDTKSYKNIFEWLVIENKYHDIKERFSDQRVVSRPKKRQSVSS